MSLRAGADRVHADPVSAHGIAILSRIRDRLVQSEVAVEVAAEINAGSGGVPAIRVPPWLMAYAEDVGFLLDALTALDDQFTEVTYGGQG